MSAATEVKGPWFDVPADATSSRCRSCGKAVYWIVTDAGKRMPVDCAVDGGAPPVSVPPWPSSPGRGVSHFATCPQAGQWRKP